GNHDLHTATIYASVGTTLGIAMSLQGDHVAVIGENRKLIIFPLAEVNEMTRGKGVRLQRYKDGGLGDIKTFTLKQGLIAYDRSDRARTFDGLKEWLGQRAQAGRLPPKGFPVGHSFGGGFGAE
ncbi:MAG: hypothetical protein CL676_13020, partial [Bdellovibrionaceae bacterium]|nr:hypothetical protein [Pseudobdellovibrionaceae bacterium]